jgi:integrase
MPTVKLTKREIDTALLRARAAPGASKVILWDTELKAFACVIYPPSPPRYPEGVATYVVRYRMGRRDRRVKLGRHGAITVEQARGLAKAVFYAVAEGRDPLEERRAARSAIVVRDLWEKYETEHLAKRKPATQREVKRIFKASILPELGARAVADLSHNDAARLHARFTDRPYMGNRILAALSALLTFAEKVGERSPGTNPCRFVEDYPEQRRTRHLSIEELGRLGAALDAQSAEGEGCAADGVRLLALLGARRDEVRALRWEWIDAERRLIAHPDTKGGRVLRALGPQVLAILDRRREAAGDSPWVLPGRKAGQPLSAEGFSGFVRRATKAAKIEDATAHTLRHTFATHAAEIGTPELVIAALLGHKLQSVTAGYTHLTIDGATRTAAERVQGRIAAALARQPEGDKVVRLRKRPKKGAV